MASKDDISMLLWHYRNLYQSTELLVGFCSAKGVSMLEGFRDVVEQIANLEKQLKEVKE